MSTSEWAKKKEIELACKYERGGKDQKMGILIRSEFGVLASQTANIFQSKNS